MTRTKRWAQCLAPLPCAIRSVAHASRRTFSSVVAPSSAAATCKALSWTDAATDRITFEAYRGGDDTEMIGQFGGGLECRITHHIGITTDYSWNVIDGPQNNFGMVRAGVNFAF